jgi:hypothetical protein
MVFEHDGSGSFVKELLQGASKGLGIHESIVVNRIEPSL